jgi:outer membrane immunogenic protein
MAWIARTAALALLAATAGSAAAADFSRPTYYTATGPMSWTGPYLGANLGYQWGQASNTPANPSGVVGGLQGGYLWQQGRFVFGGEADLQFSDASDTRLPFKLSNDWFGTMRARAGYTVNNYLIYGTAGFAVGELTVESVALQSESHTNVGWTAGLGVEAGLAGNWTAKVEYLYVDLANSAFTLTGTNSGFSTSVLRTGLNYHF